MPLPPSVDFDRIANAAFQRLSQAIRDWMGGTRTEEALLNDVIRTLRTGNKCDVGRHEKVIMRSQVASLHRKGPGSTDAYGADLAVTVYIEDDRFAKTALFQFKNGSDYDVRVRRDQLEQASVIHDAEARTFLSHFNTSRQTIRLKLIDGLLESFKDGKETKGFDASDWNGFARWLWLWLQCEEGLPSDFDDLRFEAALQAYVHEVPEDDLWLVPWGRTEPAGYSDAPVPARYWLALFYGTPQSSLINETRKRRRT